MRRPRALAVTVAVLVAAGAAVVWVGTLRPWQGQAPCDVATSPGPGDPGSATAAPQGGAVTVVEKGATKVNGGMSIGAVLENTASAVAYRTRVAFHLYDAQQRPLPPARPGTPTVVEVPVILPGQRIGVGAFLVLPAGSAQATVTVAVEPGATRWWSRQDLGADLAPVTAAYRGTERPQPEHPQVVAVSYVQDSGVCRDLVSRGVAVVFRDAQGEIVGGSVDVAGSGGGSACGRGRTDLRVDVLAAVPASARDAGTQVFPYCDIASAPPPGGGVDQPWN